MAGIDPTKFTAADELRFKQVYEKTLASLSEQRDLMREITEQAKKLKLSFDAENKSIGSSIVKLTQQERLQAKINDNIFDFAVINNNIVEWLKKRAELEKQNTIASRITLLLVDDQLKLAKQELALAEKKSRQLQFQHKLFGISNHLLNQMGELGKFIQDSKFPDWSDVIKKGLTNFMDYDKASFTMRKSLGLVRGEFNGLQKNIKSVGIDLQDSGVTFDQVAAATTAIAHEFNSFVASNKELVSGISVIAAQLGISEAESAKFLKTMSSIGNTTVKSQSGMMGFAREMATAAGVPLPTVMRDVADASDDIRIFTGRSVDNLIKAVVQARQMGTSLLNMALSAKKLLDFQTSIADEMEASVLLGKDVNLQEARNLAYRRDIVGANKEILRITKQIDFNNMDPYQAEAFAKATGKSVQELQDMLQADKEIQAVRYGTNEELKKQLVKYEELKRVRENEAKDIGKAGEARVRQMANQERINQLQNQFNKLMTDLSGPVMDVVEPLLKLVTTILPPLVVGIEHLTKMSGTVSSIAAGWLFIIKPVNAVVKSFMFAGKSLSIMSKLTNSLIAGGVSLGRSFAFMGNAFKFFGVFGKVLGPIGLVISAFQFISSLMERWEKTPKGFLGGLEAIGGALYDVFLKPFVDAWDWISSKFVGHSPSQLGLGILHGIVSIGSMLIDAITAPFRTAFNIVSGIFGGVKLPKISEVIAGKVDINSANVKTASGPDLAGIIVESNNKLVAKMDELINLMSSGGIAVNIDGVKASTLLARAQKERGAYGTI